MEMEAGDTVLDHIDIVSAPISPPGKSPLETKQQDEVEVLVFRQTTTKTSG